MTDSLDHDWSLLDDTVASYWFVEFCRRGMCTPQAEVLATQPQLDRHAVRDTIDHGCDPDTAFLIYAA